MVSGAQTSIAVAKEATFASDPGGTYSGIFGHGTKITSLEKGNTIDRIFGLGSRGQTVNLEKQFTGAISVEYVLSNPWSFAASQGKGATTGPDGNGIYTHTFSEQDSLPSYSIKNNLNLATPVQQILLGSVLASKSISASVGDPVVVTDDFVYANETFSATAYVPQIAETFNVYSFANGTLSLPDGTTVATVQSCEVSIANNSSIIYGLGSRVGTAKVDLQREYTVRASIYLTNPAVFWQVFYAGGTTSPFSGTAPGTITETPTLTLTFDNGLTLGNQRQIKLAFSNVKMDTYSLPQDVTAPVIEDATLFARSLSVTALNATATIPASWYA